MPKQYIPSAEAVARLEKLEEERAVVEPLWMPSSASPVEVDNSIGRCLLRRVIRSGRRLSALIVAVSSTSANCWTAAASEFDGLIWPQRDTAKVGPTQTVVLMLGHEVLTTDEALAAIR